MLKEVGYSRMRDILRGANETVYSIRFDYDGVQKDSYILNSLADLQTWEEIRMNVWDSDRYYIRREK